MAQATIVIANGAGAAVRAAINSSNEAQATKQSSSSAPSPTYPFMDWADIGNDLLKQRNSANSAWIIKGTLSAEYGGLPASSITYDPGSPALLAATDVQAAIDELASTTASAFTSGTPVASTSGTAIDFAIPSWAKKITVMFHDVSKSSNANFRFQLGDSGGVETTGYKSAGSAITGSNAAQVANSTSGFDMNGDGSSSAVVSGGITFDLLSAAAFLWTANGCFARTDSAAQFFIAGSKSLSEALTTIRITTTSGSDTFDFGNINVLYA